MTLFELINAIDSDNVIIKINGDDEVIAKKVGGNNILVEKWRLGNMILSIPNDILNARVTNYALRITIDTIPELEVGLEGIEPSAEEEEEEEEENDNKICSGRCPWASEITLKSLLSLFGDQASSICIIRSGIGRIYAGSIGGFMSSMPEIYNEDILDSTVKNVYNETDMASKKRIFFIRIGGSK